MKVITRDRHGETVRYIPDANGATESRSANQPQSNTKAASSDRVLTQADRKQLLKRLKALHRTGRAGGKKWRRLFKRYCES
jgi:hypothetical protein